MLQREQQELRSTVRMCSNKICFEFSEKAQRPPVYLAVPVASEIK
jgi:hypothetical protein